MTRFDVMGIQGPGDAASGGNRCVHSAYMYCEQGAQTVASVACGYRAAYAARNQLALHSEAQMWRRL